MGTCSRHTSPRCVIPVTDMRRESRFITLYVTDVISDQTNATWGLAKWASMVLQVKSLRLGQ